MLYMDIAVNSHKESWKYFEFSLSKSLKMKNILFAIIFALVVLLVYHVDAQGAPGVPVAVGPTAPLPSSVVAVQLPPRINSIYSNTTKVICNYNKLPLPKRVDQFSLADVDSSLCSHVIYNFASIDPATLSIRSDSIGAGVADVLALRQKGVIVILSVSTINDPLGSSSFSRMVHDGLARNTFVQNAVHLLNQFKFDGLDIHWDFPNCWDGFCAKGHGSLADKGLFVNLLRELKVAFHYYKLQLMVSVSPLESVAENAYAIKGISDNVDFINLLTYDLNNQSYAKTAIHSAFQGDPPSAVHTLDYWKSMGAAAHKLIFGIPTFGRTFTLAKDTWNVVGSPSSIGKATLGLNEPGLAAYFEVCTGLDYQFVENVGSYAYKEDQWVSFDDVSVIKLKGEYIRKNNLGGVAITSLDTDDYSGTKCGQGKYPLVKAVRSALGF